MKTDASDDQSCSRWRISRFRRSDETAFAALQSTLVTWNYVPYPPLQAAHVLKIDLFWAAHRGSEIGSGQSSTALLATSSVCGVVGVVLEPVGSASVGAVSAYLQLVYVCPEYRRHGIGTQLLLRVLIDLASDHLCVRVARVRLHTMVTSSNTTLYVRRVLEEQRGRDSSNPRYVPDGLVDARHPTCLASAAAERCEQQAAEVLAHIRATQEWYYGIGFRIRRNCHRYYANLADAVDMVLEGPLLSRAVQRANAEATSGGGATRKRSRAEGCVDGGGHASATAETLQSAT